MSRFRWTKSAARMCSMLASVPVSRLSTQMTRWPRRRSSSHRCDPRNPAPPVTRLVGMARVRLSSAGGSAQDVLIAPADGQFFGVEVLQEGLGELARGAQLVAKLGQGDRATVAIGQADHPLPQLSQDVHVEMLLARDPDCP